MKGTPMSRRLKEMAALALVVILGMAGCTPYHVQGAGIGSYAGSIVGALLDQRNPWRGGAIGATLGAIAGATIAEISVQGAREAAVYGRPVIYRTEGAPEGYGGYIAEPVEPGPAPGAKRCGNASTRMIASSATGSKRFAKA